MTLQTWKMKIFEIKLMECEVVATLKEYEYQVWRFKHEKWKIDPTLLSDGKSDLWVQELDKA